MCVIKHMKGDIISIFVSDKDRRIVKVTIEWFQGYSLI